MFATRRHREASWPYLPWGRVGLMMLVLAVCPFSLFAQRRLSVVDVETLAPVAGANVASSEGTVTTDSLGMFSVSDTCKTLVFSHVNYESRIVNLSEVHDTVYLISKLLYLNEVVVFGQGKKRDLSKLKELIKTKSTEAELAEASLGIGIKLDLWKVLNAFIPKKWRKSYRREQRRKRFREALDNY